MSGQRTPMRTLATLHVVVMAALFVWWSAYFWHHTPAREPLRAHSHASTIHARRDTTAPLADRTASSLARHARLAVAALAIAAADITGGLVVLALFAVGTGIYVRRLEIWLQARGSGEAMTFAGTGLDDKALAANDNQEHRP